MCVHKKIDKIGRWLLMITVGVMAAGLLAARLHAQSFIISQNGKSVGTATLSLRQANGGYDTTSGTKIDMPGLKYTFTSTQTLDSGYRLTKAQLNGAVNGTAATVNAVPEGRQFLLKISANDRVTNTPLAFHPLTVFYPDFDPSALQILLNLGAAHNNRDLWALIPKQTGIVTALQITTKADEQGTLDDRAITVHHISITQDTGATELFSGSSNELLQAEWTDEGFAMVRQGFKLTPPRRPTAAPPVQPATPQGQAPQPQ